MKLTSKFDIGQKVHVNGDEATTLHVYEISFTGDGIEYRLEYWNNGSRYDFWCREWRMTAKDNEDNRDAPRDTWPRISRSDLRALAGKD